MASQTLRSCKANGIFSLYRCSGLLLLEMYTTKEGDDLKLPDFLEVVKEVTDDPQYSMFQLSFSPTTSLGHVYECRPCS